MPVRDSGTPQVENGYTRIANELLEQLLKARLSGREWRIIVAIIRQTYGWQKHEDKISLSQFEKATGIPRNKIWLVTKGLIDRNIIKKTIPQKGHTGHATYSINKHYKQWKRSNSYTPKRGIPQKGVMLYPKKGYSYTPKRGTPTAVNPLIDKEIGPPKESIKKVKEKKGGETPPAIQVMRENSNRFPTKAVWNDITEAIGDKPEDLEFWGKVVKGWILRGYNPINVAGMLECYHNREIPTSNGPTQKKKSQNVRL